VILGYKQRFQKFYFSSFIKNFMWKNWTHWFCGCKKWRNCADRR